MSYAHGTRPMAVFMLNMSTTHALRPQYMDYASNTCTMATVHASWPWYMFYGHGACTEALVHVRWT